MNHLLSGLIYELMFQMRQQPLKAAYNSNFTVRHITLQQQNEQNSGQLHLPHSFEALYMG